MQTDALKRRKGERGQAEGGKIPHFCTKDLTTVCARTCTPRPGSEPLPAGSILGAVGAAHHLAPHTSPHLCPPNTSVISSGDTFSPAAAPFHRRPFHPFTHPSDSWQTQPGTAEPNCWVRNELRRGAGDLSLKVTQAGSSVRVPGTRESSPALLSPFQRLPPTRHRAPSHRVAHGATHSLFSLHSTALF